MSQVKWLDEYCHVCGKQLNSWDSRCSIALKHKHLTCEKCIAAEYDMEVETFRNRLENFFGMRPCVGI